MSDGRGPSPKADGPASPLAGAAAGAPPHRRRTALRAAQIALIAVATYFIVRYLARSWASVSAFDWTFSPGWLALSGAAFLLFYFLQALAWWLLLRGVALRSPPALAVSTWARSILARYIPGNVFMFVGRAWMSHDQGLPLDRVTAAMVYEQALQVCSALVAAALLFPFWRWHRDLTAISLLAVPVIVALLHPRVFTPVAARLLRLLHRPPLEATMSFSAVLGLLGYYVLAWAPAGVGAWLLARAVTGLSVGALPLVLVAFVLSYVIGMAAFVFPSGLGVREAVLGASLSRELPGGVALAWALLLRLWVTAMELAFVGLAVLAELLLRRWAARREAAGGAGAGTPAARPVAAAATPPGTARLLPPGSAGELDEAERARLFRRDAVYVLAGAVAFAVVYSLLSWLKYRAYMDARFDLGNMVQAVYNTAHGHFLQITTGDVRPRQMSRLGAHVDPIVALFALPWLIWPSPVMLLVGQAVVVATGAWPAYRLGARVTRDPRAGALLAGAFLLYPALGFLVLNEFHPVALATPLLLWAFLYLEEDKWVRAAVFLTLAALCKEDVPLVIALMGVYFAVRKRSWRPLLVTAAAAVYFGVAFWGIIPHFNHGQSTFVSRYSTYGDSASAVVKHGLTHPSQALGDVLSASNLRYWLALLWPFGFAPLLSPLTLLIAAPELLLNALSAIVFQRRIEFHYTAPEIPFVYAALVLGLMRLWRWLGGGFRSAEAALKGPRVSRETLAVLVLVVALAGNFFLGPLPFSLPGAAYGGRAYARTAHDDVLDQAVKLIPPGAAVSVNNNVGGQLSARRVIYVFPYFAKAQYVIVDQRYPFVYDRQDPLMHQLVLGRLATDPRFRSIFAKDGVLVFKRIAP